MNQRISRNWMIVVLILCLGTATAAVGAEALQERTGVVSMGDKPLTVLGHPIAVGEKAPDFTVLDRKMQPVSLHDYAGKVLIITTFPSIDTKVCSLQTRTFNHEADQLDNVQILTISADLPFALDRFCAAEGINNLRTLSDHRDFDFARKYGFWIKELRLLARGTVIVDRDGIVRYVEWVSNLGKEPDYEKAMAVAKKLAAAT